jgi:thiol-disulfide isomerase/thioredoxin
MKKAILVSISCSWLIVAAPGGRAEAEVSREVQQKIQTLSQEALTLYQKKDYEKSNETFRRILELIPAPKDDPYDSRLANVHYNMTLNHALLGQNREALDSLRKAVASGFWNHEYLVRDPTLKELRKEKEFEGIVDRARRGTAEVAFGLKDLDGKEIKKEDHAGKVLIIDVWGTWCPPCRREIPAFVKLQEKYGPQGLQIIGLTWEKRPPDEQVKARVSDFVKSQNVNYPIVLMSEGLNRTLNVPGYPTTYYIGRDGLLADRVTGEEPYAELERRVTKLLAAPDPTKGAKKEDKPAP